MASDNPNIIFLFSGKRKSGKDYVTDLLHSKLRSSGSMIIRIAGPIKHEFALLRKLDSEKLYSFSSKEIYREEMVKWSQEIRDKDSSYFVREALKMYNAYEHPIWIVSDVRRLTDMKWFLSNYKGKVFTIRISALEETRKERGFIFTPNIDDAETECNLDSYDQWDFKYENESGNDVILNEFIDKLFQLVLAMNSS